MFADLLALGAIGMMGRHRYDGPFVPESQVPCSSSRLDSAMERGEFTLAQSGYPIRPIKVIVPYLAGGATTSVRGVVANGWQRVWPPM